METQKNLNEIRRMIKKLINEEFPPSGYRDGEDTDFLPQLNYDAIDTTNLYKFIKDALGQLDIGSPEEQAEAAMKIEEAIKAKYTCSLK